MRIPTLALSAILATSCAPKTPEIGSTDWVEQARQNIQDKIDEAEKALEGYVPEFELSEAGCPRFSYRDFNDFNSIDLGDTHGGFCEVEWTQTFPPVYTVGGAYTSTSERRIEVQEMLPEQAQRFFSDHEIRQALVDLDYNDFRLEVLEASTGDGILTEVTRPVKSPDEIDDPTIKMAVIAGYYKDQGAHTILASRADFQGRSHDPSVVKSLEIERGKQNLRPSVECDFGMDKSIRWAPFPGGDDEPADVSVTMRGNGYTAQFIGLLEEFNFDTEPLPSIKNKAKTLSWLDNIHGPEDYDTMCQNIISDIKPLVKDHEDVATEVKRMYINDKRTTVADVKERDIEIYYEYGERLPWDKY